MGPGSPFPDFVNGNELESATLLDQLSPIPTHPLYPPKSGCETWSVAWSPDGAYIAWSCGHRVVKLIPWNRFKHTLVSQDNTDHDGRILEHKPVTIDCGELVWAVAFGSKTAETKPHSTSLNWYHYKQLSDLILATGLSGGRIRIWDVKTGKLLLELLDHRDVIRDLKFAPDGSLRLISASRDNTLKVWEMEDDGNMCKTLKGVGRWIYACAWSPDAKMLCSVGDKRSVILWEMKNYRLIGHLEGHLHDVCGCDFSPDGAILATCSYDTRVILWDPYTREKLKELGHMFPTPSAIYAGGANGSYVRSVSFSHDGRHISTVADDSYLRFWDVFDTEAPVQVATINNALCASFSVDGAVLAVGTRNGSVSLWLAPMQVSSLQHICRMALRRVRPSTDIIDTTLPHRLKSYLLYKS